MKLILLIGLMLCLTLLTLLILGQLDHRRDRAEMDRLINTESLPVKRFNIDMVESLPEPARRFFRYTINDGALLYTVADIHMQGKFSLGDKDSPNYMPMSARQILAAPAGFIWKTKVGKGLMQMSGSDSADWTRFWINGLIPVVRAMLPESKILWLMRLLKRLFQHRAVSRRFMPFAHSIGFSSTTIMLFSCTTAIRIESLTGISS